MIKDSFVLALKNLKHRGIRSWLTLLGIFIGITAVVSLISLGNALQLAVSSQFGISTTEVITIEAGGMNLGAPGAGAVNPLTIKEYEAIERLSSVESTLRVNIESGKLEYKDIEIFGFATGLPEGDNRKFAAEFYDLEVEEGRLLKETDSGKVFLGYNFYVDKVGLGNKLIPGKKIIISGKEFEVIGILDKKGSFIYDNIVYMNQDELEELMEIEDTISSIYVKPKDKEEMDKTKEDIEKALRKVRDVKEGEEDFIVSTPEASMSQVNGILSGVKAFIVIVALISIFIGALGIVNTMTTSVMERKKEIGIMKSIGAKNGHIFLQFFIEAGLLGLIGGLIGAIVGTFIGFVGTLGINSFVGADLKPKVDFLLISLSLLGSFLIGAASGIIPAMKASKQSPVDALRS